MTLSLNRRAFTLGTAGLALATALPAAAQETRSVTSSLGTYDIPADPKRVVAIDSRLDMQPALALGLTVIGYSHSEPGAWVPKPADAIFFGAPPNVEQILAANPDLIICSDYDPTGEWWPIDRLKTFAPVVPTRGDAPWKDQFRELAALLDMTDAGEKAIAEYDALITEIKARHGDKLANKAIVSVAPDSSSVYLMNGLAMLQPQVIADLGAKTIPAAEGQLYDGGEVVPENFGERLGDIAGLLVTTAPGETPEILAEPLWQRLPAVQAGAVVLSDGNINYGSIYSAIQVARLIDDLYGKIA